MQRHLPLPVRLRHRRPSRLLLRPPSVNRHSQGISLTLEREKGRKLTSATFPPHRRHPIFCPQVHHRTFSHHGKRNKRPFCWSVLLLFLCTFSLHATNRRVGKLDNLSWSPYFDLGQNSSIYSSLTQYPDFSPVGALYSNEGYLGTGTLVAPSVVVTAAHLFRNSFSSPTPDPSSWEFILHSPFTEASAKQRFEISQINLHPGWEARLPELNGKGDGDMLGVDLAIVILKKEVTGVYPAKLPVGGTEPLGEKVVVGGFGNLVDGASGAEAVQNQRRVGGLNTLDRVVLQVDKPNVPTEYLGGLLAIDFDSPQLDANTLGSGKPLVDNLSSGNSDPNPVELEASTAVGDSGGPAFMQIGNAWRIIGTVSYGTSDSTYGDVTVFTRLASHESWIAGYLPSWKQARKTGVEGWLESDWFGYFLPLPSKWNFHPSHGWVYSSGENDESFWAWQENLGWWWSDLTVYPFIYSSERMNWLYFDALKSTPQEAVFYDYGMGDWVRVP